MAGLVEPGRPAAAPDPDGQDDGSGPADRRDTSAVHRTDPAFTKDGRHLAFLSVRTFDPVYDAFVFDLSFPQGCRPHLVSLAADTPSPFDPRLRGRSADADDQTPGQGPAAPPATGETEPAITHVDLGGLDQRVTAVPVAAGRI